MTAFHGNIGFNAHHSPMGAYFSFTCGHFGTRGGLGVQMGKPADQDLFIGVKEGGRYEKLPLRVLPFFDGAEKLDPRAAYVAVVEGADQQRLAPFGPEEMVREYGWGTDRWKAGGEAGVEFSIYTAFGEIPEPGVGSAERVKAALLPAVTAEVVVDNRKGTGVRTGFFAVGFRDGGVRVLDVGAGRVGIAWRAMMGMAGEVWDVTEEGKHVRLGGDEEVGGGRGGAFGFVKWWPQDGLEDRSNPVHLLGTCGGIGFEVPAGRCYALRMGVGCYVDGVVTTGMAGRYLYTRHYGGLEEVLRTAMERFCELKGMCRARDEELMGSGLNVDQQFLLAHATRSYYGNTELLEVDGGPYWIVNEGEYCMMNTLDLAVDQMFWELRLNPWVVRNVLDGFLKRYSYVDEVKDAVTGERRPGGISFCHDQGTHNQFSPAGRSAYELRDLTGCFSFMTQEELCNWILMAASYVARTGDRAWARANRGSIEACGASMLAREGKDSACCESGQEITSYDSLDESLGQARNNLYMAVKCWATYLGLGHLSGAMGDFDVRGKWMAAAYRVGQTVVKQVGAGGIIPAVFEAGNKGNSSWILPAIEGLVYPMVWRTAEDLAGHGQHGDLIAALKRHVGVLLSDAAGRNRFVDGGIRLSSTSDNSWASKIAIVGHVAREVFDLDEMGAQRNEHAGASGWEKSDAAHVKWQTEGASAYWCCSDQIVNGVARGSKYYPRIVTAILWLGR